MVLIAVVCGVGMGTIAKHIWETEVLGFIPLSLSDINKLYNSRQGYLYYSESHSSYL